MDNLTSIFIKRPYKFVPFMGSCWPGESVWIDFLNENAQNYWGSLMKYDKFVGSSPIYSFWNDMNEPSVFNTISKTVPLDMVHYTADNRKFEHRDVHNVYGALQQRSSFRGMLARDQNHLRPFVLTRSFFLGSQKFGAYWTGDNRAIYPEV